MKILTSVIFLILLLFLMPSQARATLVFDVNGLYFSDNLDAAETNSAQRTFYNLFLGFSLDRRDRLQVGWSYSQFAVEDELGSTTASYSSTQMGPGLLWYLDRRRSWRLGAYYHLQVTGDYEITGGTPEEWRGSSYAADFGYQFHYSPKFSFGIRLNYSSSAFSESFVGSTKTDVSYSRSLIYPSVAVAIEL